MIKHFKKHGNEDGEDRSEHPIVKPQSSVNSRESLIDIRSKFRDVLLELKDVLFNSCEVSLHVGYSARGGPRFLLAGSRLNQSVL